MEVVLHTLQQYELFNNSLWQYMLAACYFIVAMIVLHIFRSIVLKKAVTLAKKTKNQYDDAVIAFIHGLKSKFYISISLYIALQHITMPHRAMQIVTVILLLLVVYEIIQAIADFFDALVEIYLGRVTKKGKGHAKAMLRILRSFIVAILWVLVILVILSNLGINVTAFVASLGIGGIAIALALQNVLSDFFSSFSIFMDKPFQVGDYIAIGESSGTVRYIGLKTTRIETLRGEELVMPNKEVTSAQIQNFGQLKRRRESFTFGVEYETAKKKLESIPGIVERVIKKNNIVDFDRCNFSAFGDFSLNFDCVYYVNSNQFIDYVTVKEKILFAILEEFTKNNIGFAYPTQVVKLQK